MKTNKLALILGLLLIPLLINAQENKQGNNVITQETKNGVSFSINASLDSDTIENIQKAIEEELQKEQKRREEALPPEQRFFNKINEMISNQCPAVKKDAVPALAQDLFKRKQGRIPADILCDSKYIYMLDISKRVHIFEVEEDWPDEQYTLSTVLVYSASTGEYLEESRQMHNSLLETSFEALLRRDPYVSPEHPIKQEMVQRAFKLLKQSKKL